MATLNFIAILVTFLSTPVWASGSTPQARSCDKLEWVEVSRVQAEVGTAVGSFIDVTYYAPVCKGTFVKDVIYNANGNTSVTMIFIEKSKASP